MSLELAIIKPKAPSSSDTTTDSTRDLPVKSLYALFDGRAYILEHHAIRQIVQEFSTGLEYPPFFALCFDDVSIKVYSHVADQSIAAASLKETVNIMINELKDDASSSEKDEPSHSNMDFSEAQHLLQQKRLAWQNHVDGALYLTAMFMRQGEDELQPQLRQGMDEVAKELKNATVHSQERAMLQRATMSARQEAESELNRVLQTLTPGKDVVHHEQNVESDGEFSREQQISQAKQALKAAYQAQLWGDLLPAHHA